jgi:hypothetical protein
MGQTTHQIEAHIDSARENLGSNLNELERKVKSVTDWKQHFQTSPMTMLGLAFGGGILLATALGGRNRRGRGARDFSREATGPQPHSGTDHQKFKALETWDNIKGALIGVAATRFKDFVGEVIPGFEEQFRTTEQKTRFDQADVPLPH